MSAAPLTVEDRVAIDDLLAAYAWSADRGQMEPFLELFTHDARIVDPVYGPYDGPDRAGPRRFLELMHENHTFPGRQHWIGQLLLDGDAEGFGRGRKLEKVGQHEADTAELFFEDVRLPAESLLGEENRGFEYMMERLPQERLSVAVANVAHAAAALEETLSYAKERQAFGRPIGTFQHNRFLLAEMQTLVDAARAFVDQCVMAHVAGELTALLQQLAWRATHRLGGHSATRARDSKRTTCRCRKLVGAGRIELSTRTVSR